VGGYSEAVYLYNSKTVKAAKSGRGKEEQDGDVTGGESEIRMDLGRNQVREKEGREEDRQGQARMPSSSWIGLD
jgi:hypothetical protein